MLRPDEKEVDRVLEKVNKEKQKTKYRMARSAQEGDAQPNDKESMPCVRICDFRPGQGSPVTMPPLPRLTRPKTDHVALQTERQIEPRAVRNSPVMFQNGSRARSSTPQLMADEKPRLHDLGHQRVCSRFCRLPRCKTLLSRHHLERHLGCGAISSRVGGSR